MLRSFRVANHKSIRDEQELVLLPAYDKDREVVPVAGIFGANASGKSNLLDALRFMQEAVRTSFARWEAGSGVPRNRFRLNPAAEMEPSLFAVDLLIGDVQYAYGFTADSSQIIEEWLYSYPHRRKRVIFERDHQDISFGSTVADHKAKSELMSGLTRENSLLLSAAAQANQDAVMPVYDWFRLSLNTQLARVGTAPLDIVRLGAVLQTDPKFLDLIKAADFGIDDIGVSYGEPVLEGDRFGIRQLRRIHREMQAESDIARQQLDGLRAANASVAAVADAESTLRKSTQKAGSAVANIEAFLKKAAQPDIKFLHGGSDVPFGLEDQSDGTLAWVSVLVEGIEVLRTGAVLVVDEIDSSLHPHLTARLLELFQDPETNPKSAQLIFTTHDATLLSPVLGGDALRRDQIWFIEKGRDGASKLYPLSDFHPRNGENTARRYLGGAYGAIPLTSEYGFRRAMLDMAGSNGKA